MFYCLRCPLMRHFIASPDITSDTVPSVAKIRYFLASKDEDISWHPYRSRWTPFKVESQRVLIWPPSDNKKWTSVQSSTSLNFWEPIIIEVILVNSTTLSSLAVSYANISLNLNRDFSVNLPPTTECMDCQRHYFYTEEFINAGLALLWKWVFRQTRWPIRFRAS